MIDPQNPIDFASWLIDQINDINPDGLSAVLAEEHQDPSGFFAFEKGGRVRFSVHVRRYDEPEKDRSWAL